MRDFNQRLSKILVRGVLKEYPDTLAVFLQGSAVSGELQNFSDVDLSVLCSKKPKQNFKVRLIRYHGKKILISYSYEEFAKSIASAPFLSLTDFAIRVASMDTAKELFSKDRSFEVYHNVFKKSVLLKKQEETLSFYFSILVDMYYKAQRAYQRRDLFELQLTARQIADKSLKLVTACNPLAITKNLYKSPSDLKQKPSGYDREFLLLAGLSPLENIESFYKIIHGFTMKTVLFLEKYKIKDKLDLHTRKLFSQFRREL